MSSITGPKAVLFLLFLSFVAALVFLPVAGTLSVSGQTGRPEATPTPELVFDRKAAGLSALTERI